MVADKVGNRRGAEEAMTTAAKESEKYTIYGTEIHVTSDLEKVLTLHYKNPQALITLLFLKELEQKGRAKRAHHQKNGDAYFQVVRLSDGRYAYRFTYSQSWRWVEELERFLAGRPSNVMPAQEEEVEV